MTIYGSEITRFVFVQDLKKWHMTIIIFYKFALRGLNLEICYFGHSFHLFLTKQKSMYIFIIVMLVVLVGHSLLTEVKLFERKNSKAFLSCEHY